MSGKGDRYRRVDPKKWDDGWERAFGKKKKGETDVVEDPVETRPRKEKDGRTRRSFADVVRSVEGHRHAARSDHACFGFRGWY